MTGRATSLDAGGVGGLRDDAGMSEPRIAVFSTSWIPAPQREITVAARSIIGALSRLAGVDVFVPGAGPPFGDGAFDVTPIDGEPHPRTKYRAVLVEMGNTGNTGNTGNSGDEETAAKVASLVQGAPVLSVGAAPIAVDGVLDVGLHNVDELGEVGDGREGDGGNGGRALPVVHHVGLYARVDPGASGRRHHGLRSVPEYVLVLGDRPGVPTTPTPSDRARWLLARFPRRYVVVLEGGVARAWRSRSCIAQFDVHTRMDLWILMAQAQGVVDLLPGDVYARECVESLRYGVPIVVPGGSAADRLARAAGGMRFDSTGELLSCVEALGDPATRATLASGGREVSDRWYGDPHGFTTRLAGALGLPAPAHSLPR